MSTQRALRGASHFGTTDSCANQTLAPGQACQVVIVVRPEAAGTGTATLTTFNDGAANSPQSVSLTGGPDVAN